MAAGTIPKPGTKYGPCANACDHVDCRATRMQADSSCRLCNQPIGYDTRFYVDKAGAGAAPLVHADCYERSVYA